MQTRQSDLSALPWSPGPSAGVSVGGGGYSEPQIRCCWLNSGTYPVVGYRPLQDPPSADLVRAQELLGCFQAVLSVELDPVVSQRLGRVCWGLSTALCLSQSLPPRPHSKGGWWRRKALSGSCRASPPSSSHWLTSSIASHRSW